MSRALPPPTARTLRDRTVQPLQEALEGLGVPAKGAAAPRS